jgi:hypothetical protein
VIGEVLMELTLENFLVEYDTVYSSRSYCLHLVDKIYAEEATGKKLLLATLNLPLV